MAFDLSFLSTFLPFLPGILNALFGFTVAKIKNGESFSVQNFAESVIVGLVVSGGAAYFGTDTTTFSGYTVVQLATTLGDKFFGIISKAFAKAKANAATATPKVA